VDLLLTDRLCCPRCGPEFGLILLAERLENRRVYEGGLGCSNCRDSFPVRNGMGDLRAAPRGPLEGSSHGRNSGNVPSAAEIGGLLGVLRGPGHLLLCGSLVERAHVLAGIVEGIEVVAASGRASCEDENVGDTCVSRVTVRSRLPFQTGSLRGAALTEDDVRFDAACDLTEAARVIAPGSRLAVFGAKSGTADRVLELGLEIIAREDTRLIARR
jgi:uncharacterized protein YbaR (Trm112 family)